MASRSRSEQVKPLAALDLLLRRVEQVVYRVRFANAPCYTLRCRWCSCLHVLCGWQQVDRKGIITHVSGVCSEVLGYSRSEMRGRPLVNHIHKDDRRVIKAAVAAQWRQAAKRLCPPMLLQYRRKRRDGKYVWMEMASTVGDIGSGQPMMLVIERCTEREKAAEATAMVERHRRRKADAARAANEDTLGCVQRVLRHVGYWCHLAALTVGRVCVCVCVCAQLRVPRTPEPASCDRCCC